MEPQVVGKKDFRKEIESHSSALTNMLIAEIKKSMVNLGFTAMSSKPDPFARLNFFSVVLEYYLETKDIYDPDDYSQISQKIKRGNEIVALLRVRQTVTPRNMENLLQISLSLQNMINTALQKKGYFFRLGKKDPKGIDAMLEIFEENVWEKKDAAATETKA